MTSPRTAAALAAALLLAPPARAADDDLALVPDDATLVVRVNAAEAYRGPAAALVKMLVDKAGSAARRAFDERMVPAPSSLDRALLILRSRSPEGGAVVVVTTSKPFDKAKAYHSLLPGGDRKRSGRVEFVAQEGKFAVAALDDRTLAAGPEPSLVGYLAAERTAGGPARAALGNAGKATAAVWLNAADIRRPQQAGAVPEPLKPLLEARAALVTADLTVDPPVFAARVAYPDAAKAAAAEKAARAGLEMARQQIKATIEKMDREALALPSGTDAEMTNRLGQLIGAAYAGGTFRQYDELLAGLPLERDGTDLVAAGRLPEVMGKGSSLAYLTVVGIGAVRLLGTQATATFQDVRPARQ